MKPIDFEKDMVRCPVILVLGNDAQGEPADASGIILQHKHRGKLASTLRHRFD